MNAMNPYPDEILVVDDTPASLKLLEDILGNAGYRVRLADDGELAFRSAKIRPPALVLLDIRMPGMDGYTVCQRFKEDEKTCSIPIIFLSALENVQEKVKAFQIGGVDYINKPIRAPEVLARINTHLSLRHAQMDLEVRNTELEASRNTLEAKVKERSAELEQTNQKLQKQIAEHLDTLCALQQSEAKMRAILDNIGIGVALISPKMEILELNRRMRQWFLDIDLAQRPICYRSFNDPPHEKICDYCPTIKTLEDGLVHETTTQTPRAGVIRNYRVVSSPILNDSGKVTAVIEMVEDITDILSLETQLQQAQKMESVGRLAGGVAHDFNNMMGSIIGHTELLMEDVDPKQPLYPALQEIRKAAERSSQLTRQLLAFARKQPIAPKELDLNDTIESMLKMLRRLIGEDIVLAWQPGQSLWPVKMDTSQVDQILVNLCVNARDAITSVGKITIETANETFDKVYCAEHPGFAPGEYISVKVSDNGCGMNRETVGRIFEPFFTTKEVGRGTGLGLSTVYGIIKQNNGFINVYSEAGRGAAFRIYLPRHKEMIKEKPKEMPAAVTTRGSETILVVEDEPSILDIITMILERLGYSVMTAATPSEAIRLAEEYNSQIDLLITDVIMPEMNGRDLAKNLISHQPGLKRLFMSGYTSDVIAHHGVLDTGIHFIQKPFSAQALAAKVREAICDA